MAKNSDNSWIPTQTDEQQLMMLKNYLLSLQVNNSQNWQQYYDEFKQYQTRYSDIEQQPEYKAERKELKQQMRDRKTKCEECQQLQQSIDVRISNIDQQLAPTASTIFSKTTRPASKNFKH